MSKRSRAESEGHVEEDEQSQKLAEVEAKLAESERHLLYLRTLKLQKLREQPGGIATDSIVQAYTDPLVHLELHSVYRKYNDMVVRLNEAEKELATALSFPNAATLVQENKRLRSALEEKNKSYDLLNADFKDALGFIEVLQTEILTYKEEVAHLRLENEKLQTEAFSWQQQVQISAAQKLQNYHESEPDMMPGVESDECNYVGSQNIDGDQSPVLAVEENE